MGMTVPLAPTTAAYIRRGARPVDFTSDCRYLAMQIGSNPDARRQPCTASERPSRDHALTDLGAGARSNRPSGDAAAWRARYAGSVAEVRRFREAAEAKFTVALVAYNSSPVLIDCLKQLRAQRDTDAKEIEIILIDNGGLERIRDRFSEFVDLHIRMKENVGLCPARNVGIAHAAGDIMSFVDDDGVVDGQYFAAASRHFDDPRVVALRGRIFARNHRYFSTVATHYDRGPAVLEDGLVTEGNCMIRKSALMELGGFAENLSPHEGSELSCRFIAKFPELRIIYAPDVVMHHDFCESWGQFVRKAYVYRNARDMFASADPELRPAAEAFLARRFPVGRRAWDQKLAFGVLYPLRRAIQLVSRMRGGGDRPYIPAKEFEA
jgi:glycosyltransferase involved in cell wall biosynthesis